MLVEESRGLNVRWPGDLEFEVLFITSNLQGKPLSKRQRQVTLAMFTEIDSALQNLYKSAYVVCLLARGTNP